MMRGCDWRAAALAAMGLGCVACAGGERAPPVAAGTGGAGGVVLSGTGGTRAETGGTGGVVPGTGGSPIADAAIADAEARSTGSGDAGAESATGVDCPAGAVLCEDFERYASGATSLAPQWETYTLSGAIKVDATKPRGGQRALHVTTQAGSAHFADIIKQSQDGSAVLPNVHFGRVMIWTAAVPPQAHWGINHVAGPTAADRRMQLKYSHGGQFGKLFTGYSQRQRPVNADGTFPPRGGGVEAGDPPTTIDCSKRSTTDTLPLNRWVCWEWKFDATNNEAHLWIDGNAITSLDIKGTGTECVAPTPASTVWQGPVLFNKLILGFDQYQDAAAQEIWFDDLVVAAARVGCP